MKKIMLLCAAGMSTSLLVNKMREAAKNMNYECDINAYGLNQEEDVCSDADIILLGPQVRHNLGKLQKKYPDIPVESIDMRLYGTMDGEKLMKIVHKKLE